MSAHVLSRGANHVPVLRITRSGHSMCTSRRIVQQNAVAVREPAEDDDEQNQFTLTWDLIRQVLSRRAATPNSAIPLRRAYFAFRVST
jgi:hypothetical protein